MDISVALFGAIFLLALSVINWRASVKAALVLVMVEGAIRKWLFPQASDLVYFLKDLVLLGAYLRYFILEQSSHSATAKHPELKIFLWISAAIIFIQAFNLRLNSSAVGLFGFKAYLWYVPLCFMAKDLFPTIDELQKFLKWYLLLIIPIGFLGIVQFFSPADSFLNTYVSTGETQSTAMLVSESRQSRVRITGTFSYISGFTTYLFVCVSLLLPMLMSSLDKIWFWVLSGALILVIGNSFMTGSRSAVLTGLVLIAGFFIFGQGVKKGKGRAVFLPLTLTLIASIFISAIWFDEAIAMFWERATTTEDTNERLYIAYVEPFLYLADKEFEVEGYGTGATHPGGIGVRTRLNEPEPKVEAPPAEGEPVRVLLELGVFGFAVWYLMKLYLIWLLWGVWRGLQTQLLKHLALMALLVHLVQLAGQVVTNHTSSVYYWFLTGFIFLLPKLDALALSPKSLTEVAVKLPPHKLVGVK
ncbi:MAG: hypothetical protein HY231_16135 [Acidobacteria bacterium]|nr:hypothetical protein [Acidobacteriota bacterium]